MCCHPRVVAKPVTRLRTLVEMLSLPGFALSRLSISDLGRHSMKPMLDPKRDLNSVVCQPFSISPKTIAYRTHRGSHTGAPAA